MSDFMKSSKQRVPDLLSDLPSEEEGKSKGLKNGSDKKLGSAASTRVAKSDLPRQRIGRVPLTEKKVQREKKNAAEDESQGSKQADSANKTVEMSLNDLLQLSMESSPQRVFDLDLRQKQLRAIPKAVQELKRLKILDLSSNRISAVEQLEENRELKELKLYDNDICDISGCLDNQKELSALQLQYNKISKIGSGLLKLKKLKLLRLDNNQLIKLEVKELSALNQLTYLDVSFNNLEDISPAVCLYSLEELWADNNRIRQLPDFGRCKRLRELHVSSNRLSSLASLNSTPQLEELDVSANFVEEFPASVSLTKLSTLNVGSNRLGDFSWLAGVCRNVGCLDISENRVSELGEELLRTLQRLPCLFQLGFSNCEAQIHSLQRALPNLEYFNGASLQRRPPHHNRRVSSGPPPPMRPMSAASAVSARQVESQMRSLDAKVESLEDQTEQAFLHIRDRLQRQLSAAVELAAEATTSEEAPPSTSRRSRRVGRLTDALHFGRQSRAE